MYEKPRKKDLFYYVFTILNRILGRKGIQIRTLSIWHIHPCDERIDTHTLDEDAVDMERAGRREEFCGAGYVD